MTLAKAKQFLPPALAVLASLILSLIFGYLMRHVRVPPDCIRVRHAACVFKESGGTAPKLLVFIAPIVAFVFVWRVTRKYSEKGAMKMEEVTIPDDNAAFIERATETLCNRCKRPIGEHMVFGDNEVLTCPGSSSAKAAWDAAHSD